MRWDSPFVLAAAGTIAIHILLLVAGDVVQVTNPPRPSRPAPHIEMVDIEVPPQLDPPPPPVVKQPEPEPEPEPEPQPQRPVPQAAKVIPQQIRTTTPSPTTTEPLPPTSVESNPSGGEQVVTLPSAPDGTTGVPVAVGRRTTARVGRGGSGGGTGAGTGAGSAAEPPLPVSVATIKKRALPKGDQSYFDAGKDYPPEARQLAVEGTIRVRLVVGADGKVSSAILINKLGHGLDELALSRGKLIEFTPAIDTNDRPVASVVVWTFTMTLPK